MDTLFAAPPRFGSGHNSGEPAAAPAGPTKADILDPSMIREQLDQDYIKHRREAAEMTAGVMRLYAKAVGAPTLTAIPDTGLPDGAEIAVLRIAGVFSVVEATPQGIKPVAQGLNNTLRFLAGRGAKIADDEMAERATSFVSQIKAVWKTIEADRKTEKAPFDVASKATQEWFLAHLEPLDLAAKSIEGQLLTPWTRQKVLEEQARARQEAERLRLEAEAERKRLADEADRLKALADAAVTAAPRDDMAALDAAIVVSEAADQAAAAASAPIAAERDAERAAARATGPATDLGRTRGSHGGVATVQTKWTFEVVDESQIPRDYWILDEAALRRIASTQKEKAAVPGVRFYSDIAAKVR